MSKLCILPWVSIEASPLGDIKPCCLAIDTIPNVNLNNTSLTQAFNIDYMKTLRQQFINGEQPDTCGRCWNEEAAGRTSKRMNSISRLKNLIENVDFTSTTSDNLIFLDLKLGNICNLKCRICGSFSSSKWAQEEIDIYPKNQTARSNLTQGRWPRENKLFWEDLYKLLPYIRYLEFTGGEPFLINEHFDLLQQAVDRGLASNIEIHYNSNTTVVPDKGLELWPHFKLVEIALSIDDIEDRFEYQRYGAKWNQAELNLESFRQLRADSNNIKLQVCMTINVQNVYYMDGLIAWVVDQNFDYVYFNMLHDIWYFNIKNLNDTAKQLITEKYKNLKLPYQEEFDRMITFMNQGDSTNCAKLIEVLTQSDLQRKQHFADHHREIAEAIGYAKA